MIEDQQIIAYSNAWVRTIADRLLQLKQHCDIAIQVAGSKTNGTGQTIQQRLVAAGTEVLGDGGADDGRGAITAEDIIDILLLGQNYLTLLTPYRLSLLHKAAVNPGL